MTPRYESAAPTLDTGTEDDIIENPEGANTIRITADELAHGRQSQGNAVEGEAEFYRRAITKGKLDAGRTVRSDYAYDFDSTDPVPPQVAARATGIKAELGDEPLHGIENRYAYRFVKRAFDLVFSAAVIVALSWLFVIIAVAIKIDDPKGPVFFKQLRCTKANRQFYMLKFRSMCVDAEERLAELQELNEKSGPVFKIADDPRIASRIIDATARRSSFGPAVASVFPPKMTEISAVFSQVKLSISNLRNLLKNSFQNLSSHTPATTNFFAERKSAPISWGGGLPMPCHCESMAA